MPTLKRSDKKKQGLLTIGIVGGIASGKSFVTSSLVALGAGKLDADLAGHEAINSAEIQQQLVQRWGPEVKLSEGTTNRALVAEKVFGVSKQQRAERRFLEALLHPRIRAKLLLQRETYRQQNLPAVVLDAPLLLEANWGEMCEVILFVACREEVRLTRAKKRGWTKSEYEKRAASQYPLQQKMDAADHIVTNDSDKRSLELQLQEIWKTYVS